MRVVVDDVGRYFDVEGGALAADGDAMVPRPTLVLTHGGLRQIAACDICGWRCAVAGGVAGRRSPDLTEQSSVIRPLEHR